MNVVSGGRRTRSSEADTSEFARDVVVGEAPDEVGEDGFRLRSGVVGARRDLARYAATSVVVGLRDNILAASEGLDGFGLEATHVVRVCRHGADGVCFGYNIAVGVIAESASAAARAECDPSVGVVISEDGGMTGWRGAIDG